MSALELRDVCYRYKNAGNNVLSDITVNFECGRLTAIVGPSGSGKTTLLSILAGLDLPTQGSILVEGDDLSRMDLDKYRRERISMIFQAFHLFPLLTAKENVCYTMNMNGVKRSTALRRAEKLLESVAIGADMFKRYPANLSGGEQQRVAIARALSSGARILLADEPTGNLDAANGIAVFNVLKRLAHDEDYCVIIVTHNTDIAAASDVVYRMSDGRLEMKEEE